MRRPLCALALLLALATVAYPAAAAAPARPAGASGGSPFLAWMLDHPAPVTSRSPSVRTSPRASAAKPTAQPLSLACCEIHPRPFFCPSAC